MHVKNEVFNNHPDMEKCRPIQLCTVDYYIHHPPLPKDAASNSAAAAAVNHINYEAHYPVEEVTVYQLKAPTLLK